MNNDILIRILKEKNKTIDFYITQNSQIINKLAKKEIVIFKLKKELARVKNNVKNI